MCAVVVVSALIEPDVVYPAQPEGCIGCRLIQRIDLYTNARSFEWVSPSLIDEMGWKSDDWTDITDYYQRPVNVRNTRKAKAIPTEPTQQDDIVPMLALLSPNFTHDVLEHLETYVNRYYTSPTGTAAVLWLRGEMQKIAEMSGRDDVSVELFDHSWDQPSIIATIPGSELPHEIVVVGAHVDSTGPGMPTGRAPGVDDDASGLVAALDVYRVLVETGFKPRRTLQFMFYAAEEVGLRGSQDIAQKYAEEDRDVIAVWQSEMNGYVGNRREIMIVTPTESDVDFDLSTFARTLVDEYCSIGWFSTFVRGQSDHASWTNRGYRATCVAEDGPASSSLNPCIHQACDDLSLIDISYVHEFAKLNLAFAVELGMY